jgi:hypothetical protein
VSSYKDISPRIGLAYDVFGNGKTAVKFNFGRYLGPATNDTIYTQNNPANRIVGYNNTAGQPELDRRQRQLCGRLRHHELRRADGSGRRRVRRGDRQLAELRQARHVDASQSGAAERMEHPSDGFAMGHQPPAGTGAACVARSRLQPAVVEHFTVTDNTLVGPSDYEKWTSLRRRTQASHGGGYPIDVYTMTAAAAARGADNYVTFENDYGPARSNYWHGIDVTVNARLRTTSRFRAAPRPARDQRRVRDDPQRRQPRSAVLPRVDPVETTLRGFRGRTWCPKDRRAGQRHVALAATVIFSVEQPTVFVGIQPTTPRRADRSELERAEHRRSDRCSDGCRRADSPTARPTSRWSTTRQWPSPTAAAIRSTCGFAKICGSAAGASTSARPAEPVST